MRSRHDREILALALPALGALAADPLVSLIDTAFVGRLGAGPLAALGLTTSIFSLAFFLFIFLAYGTTPLVGRALGRGDLDGAGRTVTQALTLALLVGVVTTALLLVLPFGWGLAGVWWGIVALMGVRALTMALRYADVEGWRGSWRERRPQRASRLSDAFRCRVGGRRP